jgi:hypothetical protein
LDQREDSCELILVNEALRVVPIVLTAAMIAIEMPAAISPYSIAVAPELSLKKRTIVDMGYPSKGDEDKQIYVRTSSRLIKSNYDNSFGNLGFFGPDYDRSRIALWRLLIGRNGHDGNVTDWPAGITADCPRRKSIDTSDQCAARCPDLSRIRLRHLSDCESDIAFQSAIP